MSALVHVDSRELVEWLEGRAGQVDTCALAFDADGTLWSGDVGEDLFEHALAERLLRDDATEELAAMAVAHGVDPEDDPNRIGRQLLDAHRSGKLPNLPAYEMMTWAYAGWTLPELETLARDALGGLGHGRRGQDELGPILDFAARRGAVTTVVSASPAVVVRVGLALLGLKLELVAAGEPRVDGDRIRPGMARPLPYGPTKRTRARALMGDATWLASFGDSDYDLDLLLAAERGVLVRPKPNLTRAARGKPSLVRLERATARS